MAAVGAGVGAGVAVVTGVGTGAGVVVHPATSMPTNKTAQTKSSKDFIAQNTLLILTVLALFNFGHSQLVQVIVPVCFLGIELKKKT
jgi:hypothetical protein